MRHHPAILAGTALALLFAAPSFAGPPRSAERPLLLAQAGNDEERREEEAPERAPAGEALPEGRPAPEAAPEERAPEPPRRDADRDAEEQPRREEPRAAPEAESPEAPASGPAPAPEAAPEEEARPREERADPEGTPADEEEPAAAPPPEEPPAPGAEEDSAEEGEPLSTGEPRTEEPRTEEPRTEEPRGEEPRGEEPRTEEPRAEDPRDELAPADGTAAPEPPRQQPAPEQEPGQNAGDRLAPPAGQEGAGAAREDAPAAGTGARDPSGEAPEAGQEGEADAGLPANAAPVLDSAKEEPGERRDEAPAGAAPAGERAGPAGDAAPPPRDDASALAEDARPAELQSATAEEGRRVERSENEARQRERPEGAEVVRRFGDRVVIRIDNRTIVESADRPRIARGAREVYYEELPRGREREVILRGDGSRVVTIRNRHGDVIRRSRIGADGREAVLVYVDERDYDRVRDWRDPGEALPPLRLAIPVRDYILDARRAGGPEDYLAFLDQPPVEQVRRLYSVDEVKRSARIRDTVRRVDLDTVTFGFGSADIGESEIARLEGVAIAMERLLRENPAETFLIEGHTDAVGSDLANLALSDRRAESVAEALTSVFAIPPENLATQGYGERYLKVATGEPERRNRRVAIRRITPLVAPPVADAR